MALYTPFGQDFQWSYSAFSTTRPSITSIGTTITPAVAPTFGAWAQIASAANVTREVYGILICFNNNNSGGATTVRNTLVDVGVDNAGGTTYLTKIPFLMASSATSYGLGSGGIWYYFPLYIKAGSSVALRATGTVVTTFNAFVTLYGEPRRPDTIRAGSYVTAFGAQVLSTTTGTTIVPGTTTKGAYTQLGVATTKSYWWWQTGYSSVDTTMTAATIHVDIAAGNATSKKILLENQYWSVTAAEQISCSPITVNSYNNVATGDLIYGRAQSAAAADTSPNLIAYGLGG